MNRWVAGFILAVGVACALRIPELDRRPMHNDEAVNAVKFGELWQHGNYRYDPNEHHGPTLPYLTAACCAVTRAPDYNHLTEARLRMVTVLAGVALILLLPLMRDGLGAGGVMAAAFFTALSPALVFYSRYWIHEELLVLFMFLALVAGWRFVQKPGWGWAATVGLAVGLMQATKETFVLPVAAAVGAAWLVHVFTPRRGQISIAWRYIAAAAGVWLLVWVALFTAFFTHATGLVDSLRTFGAWVQHSRGDSTHAHPWTFYWERLFWFRAPHGPFWTEGIILLLAVTGAASGFYRALRGESHAGLVRFLTFFTVLLGAMYSVIPYKTPWCVLGVLHGLILLAGVGVVVLWRLAESKLDKAMVAAALVIGGAHLGWQAWRASFPLCADSTNPWVYAQTSPDLLNLVGKIKAVAVAEEGTATPIRVVAMDGDYWPLPWHLREFDHVGWWQANSGEVTEPIVIASQKSDLKLDAQGTRVMVGYFQLRPQVFLELYVSRGLWERYIRR
jgi:uncharacterized protein (TIGR03663 family)